jgi:branched-chain amino acid transport system permease protein
MPRPHLALLVALLAAFGVSHYSGHIDPYHLDVLTGIGINIILAVSLNLVNGYTGQFSLGHAGFMSVGAYLAAAVSVFAAPQLFGDLSEAGAGPPSCSPCWPAVLPPPSPAWWSACLRCA